MFVNYDIFKIMKNLSKFLPIFLAVIFFVVGLLTLNNYGINWDEPVHFRRGQAYLYFFLTGKKDYRDLPILKIHLPKSDRIKSFKFDLEDDKYFRRSLYQDTTQDGNFFFKKDGGHPPLTDIFAATINWVFYQKLGLLGDIESYHLFEILTGAILILVVSLFAQEKYGVFAGLIAGLSLGLYPLFLSESHFNIKDPVGACFLGLTIYSFYKAVKYQSAKWMISSAIFGGMALGTKFNIVFLPFIILPWLFARGVKKSISKKILKSLFFYPFVVLGIFFVFWPYLWQDPIKRITEIIQFYKGVGLHHDYQPESFYIYGFNTYPIQAIIFTTPLVILFFSFIGIITSIFLFRKEKEKTSFLWLLWFLVPILRVTVPGTTIYGGVRQIMEYIPAMALLAGLGAHSMATLLRSHLAKIVIAFMFIPITLKLISLHPNEGLYFNPLIGGLKGAAKRNFPNWGVSLGNEYRQGINWLNANTQENAKLTLAIGYDSNAPRIWLRKDIDISNEFRSGIRREGEYVMELTSQLNWPSFYYFTYVRRFLKPLYEVKVEGVPILTIWKNDWESTREEYRLKEKTFEIAKFVLNEDSLFAELDEEVLLTEIRLLLSESNCDMGRELSYFYISGSDGNWVLHPDEAEKEGKEIISFFAGEKVKSIKLVFGLNNECAKKIYKVIAKKIVKET